MSLELDQCRQENLTGNTQQVTKSTDLDLLSSSYQLWCHYIIQWQSFHSLQQQHFASTTQLNTLKRLWGITHRACWSARPTVSFYKRANHEPSHATLTPDLCSHKCQITPAQITWQSPSPIFHREEPATAFNECHFNINYIAELQAHKSLWFTCMIISFHSCDCLFVFVLCRAYG